MLTIWKWNLLIVVIQASTYSLIYTTFEDTLLALTAAFTVSVLSALTCFLGTKASRIYVASLGASSLLCCMLFIIGDMLSTMLSVLIVLAAAGIPANYAQRDDNLFIESEPDGGGAPMYFSPHPWILYYLLLLPFGVGIVIGGGVALMYHLHTKRHGIVVK